MDLIRRIRRFINRLGGPSSGDTSNSPAAKRRKYTSTPGMKFTPKQIETKREKRNHYVLHEIVSVSEDRNYEFKAGGGFFSTLVLKDYIMKYGSAFLNGEGGILIAGIQDDGTVKGVYIDRKKEAEILGTIQDVFSRFRPEVTAKQYTCQFVPLVYPARHSKDLRYVTGNFVFEIHVKKGEDGEIYETPEHKVFLRRDGGVQGPLRPLQIRELAIQKYNEKLSNRKKNHDVIIISDDEDSVWELLDG